MKPSEELIELAATIDGTERSEWVVQQRIEEIADRVDLLEEALEQIKRQVADRVSWNCGSMSVESEAKRGRKVVHKIQEIIDNLDK